MYLQVKKLVLWPARSGLPPRQVSFVLGAVNVISGLSKTGKSAIIPIIDYCLGADKCSIPVKTIRQACSWFGVVLDTPKGELLLARREPGHYKVTGQMFVVEGADGLPIPDQISGPNTNVDAVRAMLNDLAGVTQLDFDTDDTGLGYKGRPSFRDMMAFVFQPQNIVANPNVLFYKADTTEHREKLRTILPYVLGAVTPQVLALQHERQRLRADLRRKEREFEAIRQLSLRWVAEIRSKVSRAYELGLLPSMPTESALVPVLLEALRSAAGNFGGQSKLSSEALAGAAEELAGLQREESVVSSTLSRLKQRFTEMSRFREATSEYRGSLEIRRDRLKVSDWIRTSFDTDHECPLCGTRNGPSSETVEVLQSALRRIEDQAGEMAQLPVAFDREYQRVRREMDLETERLNAVRQRRRALTASSKEAQTRQYQITEAARFAGALEESLERYDRLSIDSDLASEIAKLQQEVRSIEARLRDSDVRAAMSRATQRFSTLIGRILPQLDTERPNDPVQLVPDELTIKITGEDRDDYLWEIGSGANWLSYHIATSIALHELFRGLPHSAVPSFAVYDQPSQVYFPKPTESGDEGEESRELRDEDVKAVRMVFEALAQATGRSEGAWQAIVLDHASDNVWGGIDGVHRVEEWRGGSKLVPPEWIS